MLEVSRLLHLVATGLRDEADLTRVAAWVTDECGRPISPDSVAYVVETKLRPLGIIEDSSGAPTAAAPARPVLGLILHAGFVPERLVGAVSALLRPLFLPAVVTGALAALVAVDAWLLLGPGPAGPMEDLVLHPGSLLTVIGITLLAGGFHELGHATASRYGGAKPGVIGAGIYLLWPVFYNDLNDSYRLSRAGRLRADLGGVYFNAIFILVLAAAFWLTGAEVLVAAIVVQHLAVLQQFLPFLRLDGYYIVSDLAGVPDLFARVRPVLAGLAGRRPAKAVTALTPGAQAVVTVWVLLSVPLLGACLALLIVSMPALAGAAAESLVFHGRSLAAALGSGAVLPSVLGGFQLLVVAVPFVGLTAALARVLRLIGRSVRGRRPAAPVMPERHPAGNASPVDGTLHRLRLAPRRARLRPFLCLLFGLFVVLGASFAAGTRSASRLG